VLDGETAADVARLCRRLDGLPLAIELAAARTPSLTPAEILDHLDRRLDVIARRRQRGLARHRSLEAAIGWSYDRLSPAMGEFFARLGVFAGPFSAAAAQAVAAEPTKDLLGVVDTLDHLVAQSLIAARQQSGQTWYVLLDTVRAFARTRLAEGGQLDEARDRWVDWLVELAVNAVERLFGTGAQDAWVTLHSLERDLRDALGWCLDHNPAPDRAVQLFPALFVLLYGADAEPVAELGDRLVTRWPEPGPPSWPEAAATAATADLAVGELDRGEALAERALAAATAPLAAVLARRALFMAARGRGDLPQALGRVEDAIDEARRGGVLVMQTELETHRAAQLVALGRVDEALAQANAACRGALTHDSAVLRAWAALTLGYLVAFHDPVRGRTILEDVQRQSRDAEYAFGVAASLRGLGALSVLSGDLQEAAGLLGEALEAWLRAGYVFEIAVTLRWVAALMALTGRGDAASPLRRTGGAERGFLTHLFEQRHLDRLAPEDPAGPPPTLREAVALARRELAAVVRAQGEELPQAADIGQPGATDGNRFQLEGAVWTLSFADRTVRLADAKGLHDLAVLLGRPGRELHCTELVTEGRAVAHQADLGPMLDAQARRRYQARIVELQEDLVDAEDANDRGRAEQARLEMDLLVEQLAATGLGGRAPRTGSTTERARSAVSWRIRAAIKRIDAAHPTLGAHLNQAIRTGVWCVYQPDEHVRWQL
jgi:tetratricopeptide (TPR) repeat protein